MTDHGTKPAIILVEDDRMTLKELGTEVEAAFPQFELYTYSNERSFRGALPELHHANPQLFLIDVMLRWDDPRPDPVSPPSDAAQEGFFRAGIRLARLIHHTPELATTPVILFSALDKLDVESDVTRFADGSVHSVVSKTGSFEPLFRAARRALAS